MTDEEVTVKLTEHEQQIKSLKHRMDEQEEQSKTIQEIALSVQRLAINMEGMLQEQGMQGKRLEQLEQEPANSWKRVKSKVIDTVIGVIAGGVVTGGIMLVAQNIK